MTDPNALFTPRTRLRIARLIVEDGYPATMTAKMYMLSPITARKGGRSLTGRGWAWDAGSLQQAALQSRQDARACLEEADHQSALATSAGPAQIAA